MGGKEKSGRVEGNRDIRERIDERGRGREGNEVRNKRRGRGGRREGKAVMMACMLLEALGVHTVVCRDHYSCPPASFPHHPNIHTPHLIVLESKCLELL